MNDSETSGQLLEYYSDLSIHHRTMMIGFVSAYLAINQLLLLTPPSTLQFEDGRSPVAFVVCAGLIITFVLASTLHHGCHFVATAGMKAITAAELHYRHLPDKEEQMDPFIAWINRTATQVREGLAVRTFSFYVLLTLYVLLLFTNLTIYHGVAKHLLKETKFDSGFVFGLFVAAQVVALCFYGLTFFKHFRHFQIAKRELQVVLKSRTKEAVHRAIRALHGTSPHATSWASFFSFEQTRPPEDD